MKFKIDLKVFLFILVFYFTKQIELYAMIMFFALIHESGHLLAGMLLGMKPEKLEIMPYGVSISFKLNPDDYNKRIKNANKLEIKKILIALAGPFTNFLIILLVLNIKINTNIFNSLMIIYSNFLIMIFNLIPVYPLDGGRIVKGFLYICFGKKKSERYISGISFLVLIILTFLTSIVIYKVKNIAIVFIVIVLWIMYIKEDSVMKKRNKIYNLLEKTIENN